MVIRPEVPAREQDRPQRGGRVYYNYFQTMEAEERKRRMRNEGPATTSLMSRTPVGPIGATLGKSARKRGGMRAKPSPVTSSSGGVIGASKRLYNPKIKESAKRKVIARRRAHRVEDELNHHASILRKEMEELEEYKAIYLKRKKKLLSAVIKRGNRYAKVIQTFYRPILERKHKGAARIQAHVRGRYERKSLAASKVQCAARQRLARNAVRREKSSIRIQRVARGNSARKIHGRKLEAHRARIWAEKRRAARTIQKIARGNYARRRVDRLRHLNATKRKVAQGEAEKREKYERMFPQKERKPSAKGGVLDFMPSLRGKNQSRSFPKKTINNSSHSTAAARLVTTGFDEVPPQKASSPSPLTAHPNDDMDESIDMIPTIASSSAQKTQDRRPPAGLDDSDDFLDIPTLNVDDGPVRNSAQETLKTNQSSSKRRFGASPSKSSLNDSSYDSDDDGLDGILDFLKKGDKGGAKDVGNDDESDAIATVTPSQPRNFGNVLRFDGDASNEQDLWNASGDSHHLVDVRAGGSTAAIRSSATPDSGNVQYDDDFDLDEIAL